MAPACVSSHVSMGGVWSAALCVGLLRRSHVRPRAVQPVSGHDTSDKGGSHRQQPWALSGSLPALLAYSLTPSSPSHQEGEVSVVPGLLENTA